jgi:hypothetical protein
MIELLRIHALVIVARVLVRIGAAAEDISAACRRRAGRILDEAVVWCEVLTCRAFGSAGHAYPGRVNPPGYFV